MAGLRHWPGNRNDVPGNVFYEKKTDVKEPTEWRNLFASIVSNTSLTMEDIGNLRMNQLEDLLQGMSENAEREKAEYDRQMNGDGGGQEILEGDDALRALLGE